MSVPHWAPSHPSPTPRVSACGLVISLCFLESQGNINCNVMGRHSYLSAEDQGGFCHRCSARTRVEIQEGWQSEQLLRDSSPEVHDKASVTSRRRGTLVENQRYQSTTCLTLTFLRVYLFIYFYVCMYFTCYMCALSLKKPERDSEVLELEFQMTMSHHLGAEDPNARATNALG